MDLALDEYKRGNIVLGTHLLLEAGRLGHVDVQMGVISGVEAAKVWMCSQFRQTPEWVAGALRTDEKSVAGWSDAMQMVREKNFLGAAEAFTEVLEGLSPKVCAPVPEGRGVLEWPCAAGGGGDPPPPCNPPPQTKGTIAGKKEIYDQENLVRPFLIHPLSGPRPPHPLLITSLDRGLSAQGLKF